MKFRKKPVVIEAVQLLTREGARGTPGICTGGPDCPGHGPDDAHPHVHTLEGDHSWTPGDWLITGVKGERYFCKPDIFAATYEPAASPEVKPTGEGTRPWITCRECGNTGWHDAGCPLFGTGLPYPAPASEARCEECGCVCHIQPPGWLPSDVYHPHDCCDRPMQKGTGGAREGTDG